MNVFLINEFDRAFGNGMEKRLPIAFLDDAAVQNDDDACIVFCTDESSKALTELKDGFWNGVVKESVFA